MNSNFTYTRRSLPSYNAILLTHHARQRAFERFNITTDSELKKLAHSARYKGICVANLHRENYQAMNIPYRTYLYLKNKYGKHKGTDKHMYYKNMVFVFAGNKSRTLRSIIPCTQEDISKGLDKLLTSSNPRYTYKTEKPQEVL